MQPLAKQQCSPIHLANSPLGEVAFCTQCGVVSVVLQCLTVRLEANAFLELQSMLTSAAAQLLSTVESSGQEGTSRPKAAGAFH